MNQDVRNIGLKFLQDIDAFIKDNIDNLSCDDISSIYSYFFEDLKKYKGNSHGFTGLSEYLVFRFVYNMLGDLKPQKATHSTGVVFESTADSKLHIGQSMRVEIGKKLFYPDLAVMYAGELISIAQIKCYLTKGNKEVDEESAKISSLRIKFPKMMAMLIMFQGPVNKERLDRMEEDNISYLILKGNPAKFKIELYRLLPGRCK